MRCRDEREGERSMYRRGGAGRRKGRTAMILEGGDLTAYEVAGKEGLYKHSTRYVLSPLSPRPCPNAA